MTAYTTLIRSPVNRDGRADGQRSDDQHLRQEPEPEPDDEQRRDRHDRDGLARDEDGLDGAPGRRPAIERDGHGDREHRRHSAPDQRLDHGGDEVGDRDIACVPQGREHARWGWQHDRVEAGDADVRLPGQQDRDDEQHRRGDPPDDVATVGHGR